MYRSSSRMVRACPRRLQRTSDQRGDHGKPAGAPCSRFCSAAARLMMARQVEHAYLRLRRDRRVSLTTQSRQRFQPIMFAQKTIAQSLPVRASYSAVR